MIFDDFEIGMMLMMGLGLCLGIIGFILEKTVRDDKPNYPPNHDMAFDGKSKGL